MELLLLTSLSILWIVVLVILVLMLRVIRWVKTTNEIRMLQERVAPPELVIGISAPEFKARTLTNQPVRLDDYTGRAVAFVFSSPRCGNCRKEIPILIKLSPLARKNGNVEVVLVSYENAAETKEWLDTICTEERVDMTLPVLVAPRGQTDFLKDYNPSGLFPGFCLLDAQGIVQAHGTIPSPEWRKLKQTWEGITSLSPWMLNQYR